MKYYSEMLNKFFDNETDLQLEEEKYNDKKTDKDTKTKPVESKTPASRKDLAAAVDTAEVAVKEAYANYQIAKKQAEELSQKFLKELTGILDPARKAITEAEEKKYQAIKEFTKSHGTYQATYTGARAAEEFYRVLDELDDLNKGFFGGFTNNLF